MFYVYAEVWPRETTLLILYTRSNPTNIAGGGGGLQIDTEPNLLLQASCWGSGSSECLAEKNLSLTQTHLLTLVLLTSRLPSLPSLVPARQGTTFVRTREIIFSK